MPREAGEGKPGKGGVARKESGKEFQLEDTSCKSVTRSEGKENLVLLYGAAQLNEVICKDNLSLYYG